MTGGVGVKRLLLYLAITLLFVMLTACKTDITMNLYVRDIVDVAIGETIVAHGVLKLEHPGSELDDTIISIIKKGFPEASNFGVEQDGFDSFIIADIEVPVVTTAHQALDYPDSMFVIVSGAISHNEANLILIFSREVFSDLNDAVYKEYFQRLSVDDMTITVSIHNDLRYDVLFELMSVYANRVPIPFADTKTLVPRQNLEIRLSDVLRDFAYENRSVSFGRITW